MRTALHILRKDLRNFWFLAALGVVFVLISTLGVHLDVWRATATPSQWQSGLTKFVIDLAQNGPPLVIFILVIAVVQADLTVGDRAFWRTRPISPGSLLCAKLLFLFVVLAVPAVAANIFVARSVDAPRALALGIILESTGTILIVALVAALVASLTATMIQAVAVSLAAALVIMVVGSAVGSLGSSMTIVLPWELNVTYPGPRIATLGVLGGIAVLVSLAHQFLTLRTGRTLAICAVLVILAIYSAGRWPIILDSGLRPPGEFPAKLDPSVSVQVMLKPPAGLLGFTYVWDPKTKGDVPAEMVSIRASMGNVPLGRIVQVESVASNLRYDDGQELAFPALNKSYWPAFSGAHEVGAICRELGLSIPPLQAEEDDSRRLKLFVIPSEQARSIFSKPAKLYSTLRMYEIAFHEEMRMPARPGASSSNDGQRWDLREIRLSGGVVDVSLRQLVATTMFIESGGESAGRLTDGYKRGFVLLNRKLGEFSLTNDGWGSAYHPPGVLAAAERFLRFGPSWRQGGSPATRGIDEAWLKDAELIILSSREVGTFEKKVELDNFYVPEPPDTFRPQDKPFWQ
jgi:hypothetical protein